MTTASFGLTGSVILRQTQGWVIRPETSLAVSVQRRVYPLGAAESASLASLAAAPPIRITLEVWMASYVA